MILEIARKISAEFSGYTTQRWALRRKLELGLGLACFKESCCSGKELKSGGECTHCAAVQPVLLASIDEAKLHIGTKSELYYRA